MKACFRVTHFIVTECYGWAAWEWGMFLAFSWLFIGLDLILDGFWIVFTLIGILPKVYYKFRYGRWRWG